MAYDTPLPNRKRQRTLFESVDKERHKKAQISEPEDSPSCDSTVATKLLPRENALAFESEGLYGEALTSTQTELEEALPPIDDRKAIEALGPSDISEFIGTDVVKRYDERNWVKGRSSIYVDAFNLALDSVLADEAHLFNEAEIALFSHWRALCYGSQYLYVVY